MKKYLFIDFDGTLCHDRFWRSLPSELYKKVQNFLFCENKHIAYQWMRGYYTSEQINQLVADGVGIDRDLLWNLFVDDCKTMKVSQSTLKKIDGLRGRFSVILVTGNMDCFDRFTVPSLKLNEYFDNIINSYNEGILKDENNGLTFTQLAGDAIHNSFLIDDSEGVCKAFSRLGGRALQVTKVKNIDYLLKTI